MHAIFRLESRSPLHLRGAGVLALLKRLLCGNVRALDSGSVVLSPMLNLQGGTMDNVIVYADAPESCWLIVHECSREKDLRHIQKQRAADVEIQDLSAEMDLYAVVGPDAAALTENAPISLKMQTDHMGADSWLVCVAKADVADFEIHMAQRGAVMHSQGDLDVIMMENGLPSYGRELDDTINPLEVGLKRYVHLERQGFIGKEALVAAGEPRRGVIGLVLAEAGAARGMNVVHRDKDVGMVTSVCYSQRMKSYIALALVEKPYQDVGRKLRVELPDRMIEACVAALPFRPEEPQENEN